jgi:hypothetical protein
MRHLAGKKKRQTKICLEVFVGGDGGELNPPSRRRTAEIYYKLIRAFDLAS